MPHDRALDRRPLLREPLDEVPEHRDLRHASAVAHLVQAVFSLRRQFDADDDAG
jgi:hypothetical protein